MVRLWFGIASLGGIMALGLALLAGPVLAQTASIGFEEAISRLAAERERAVTCARLLKKRGDGDAIDQGELAYADAKAEADGLTRGLVVVLAQEQEPESLADLEAQMERAVAAREAFCRQVEPLIPTTGGEKNIFVDLFGKALPALIEAVKEIYLGSQEEDQLARITIQNQLEATTWPAFADIPPSS